MEGKAVIVSLLILGLVVAEIEGKRSCCKDKEQRDYYKACRVIAYVSREYCLRQSGCITISGGTCPPDHPMMMMLEDSAGVVLYTARDYCMLGCSSSVCDIITGGFINSGVAEGGEVKQAVEHCNNACTTLCNKVQLVAA